MFENDTNAAETVSRRSVLKTAGGLVAGSTVLVGLGAGTGAAETEEELRFEVEEANEEYIAAQMMLPHGVYFPHDTNFPHHTYLGLADDFIVHENEDAVSLPEDTEGLANPVEAERLDEETYRVYFHTRDVDFPEVEDEEVTLGLGVFPERTVPEEYFDTVAVSSQLRW
jgi:hypothetical protein